MNTAASVSRLLRFGDWGLFAKLITLAALAIVPVVAGIILFALPQVEAQLYSEKHQKVDDLVETAYGVLEQHGAMAERGLLTTEQAQEQAKAVLNELRYGEDGYFWMHNLDITKGYVIIPFREDLLGKDLNDIQDANGTHIFREFDRLLEANDGRASMEYAWTKPSEMESSPKYASMQLYQPWGWVVGTGIYIDDVEAQVAALKRRMMWVLLGALALAGGLVFVFSVRLRRPIKELEEAAGRVSDGDLDVTVAADTNDEVGRLAASFNGMVATIKDALAEARAQGDAAEAAARQAREAQEEAEEQQHYLARSVDQMLDQMNRFADGDLTVRARAEREDDAIGQLFSGFNRAASNLHGMLRQVGIAVEETASATSEISATTDQLASSTQEQSSQADEVAAAVEQMTRTIIENSQSTKATAGAAEEGGRRAKDGGAVVEETIGKIREIADVVGTSADRVEELGASSKKIGEIVGTIEDIAEQTNLLALNAAIEAARAGEQGRGFAVVADEVRKLAERTAQATGEIAGMIAQVQSETEEAVAAMRAGTERVDEGLQLADRTGEALREIVASTEEIGARMTLIASASEEQSVTSEQISQSVQGISTVTQESAAGVSQIAQSVDGLERLTVDLRAMVERFRLEEAQGPAARTRAASHDRHASSERSEGPGVSGDGSGTYGLPQPVPRSSGKR